MASTTADQQGEAIGQLGCGTSASRHCPQEATVAAVLSPEMIAIHAAKGGRSGVQCPRDTLRLDNDEPASDPRGGVLSGTPGVALRYGSDAARAAGIRRARWSRRSRRAAGPLDQRKHTGRAAFAAAPLPEQGIHLRRWSEKSAPGAPPLPLPRRLRRGERGSRLRSRSEKNTLVAPPPRCKAARAREPPAPPELGECVSRAAVAAAAGSEAAAKTTRRRAPSALVSDHLPESLGLLHANDGAPRDTFP